MGKSGIPPRSGRGKRQFKSDYPDFSQKNFEDEKASISESGYWSGDIGTRTADGND